MIPLTKDEIVPFTPAALRNMAVPPVFLFRPATRRDQRTFQRMGLEEGLRVHSVERFRDEQKLALKLHSSPQEAEDATAMLQELWDKADQGVEAPAEEIEAGNALLDSLSRVHQPLRVMQADNRAFSDTAPALALGLFLVGWQNIELPYRRVNGFVPIDTIGDLEDEIRRIEREAIAANLEGASDEGVAWIQLCTHALGALEMNKDEAGNSPSLSPTPSIQNGSEAAGSQAASSQDGPIKTTRRGKSSNMSGN